VNGGNDTTAEYLDLRTPNGGGIEIRMTAEQHEGFTNITASGGNDWVSIVGTSGSTVNAHSDIETYTFVNSSGDRTLYVSGGNRGVNVSGDGFDVTVDIGQNMSVSGSYDLRGASGDTIVAHNNGMGFTYSSIEYVNGGNDTTAEYLDLRTPNGGGIEIRMTAEQHEGFTNITASGSNDWVSITTDNLSGPGVATLSGFAQIEHYALANGSYEFTFGSGGQTLSASGGTLLIHTSGYLAGSITDLAAANATDITFDVTDYGAGVSGFAADYGSFDFSSVDTLIASAAQMDIVDPTLDFGASPQSLDIRGSSGDQTLFGTSGNDKIQGGLGADTVDITAGGHDTLVFTSHAGLGVHNDMTITGFTADNASGDADILDFSALGLQATNDSTDLVFGHVLARGPISSAGHTPGDVNIIAFDTLVQAFDDSPAALSAVATAIDGRINGTTQLTDAYSKMIFIIANKGTNDPGTPDTNVFLWADDGTDTGTTTSGGVDASELTRIGVLHSFSVTDIAGLTADNFQPNGFAPVV
jgi:hypothetical protein